MLKISNGFKDDWLPFMKFVNIYLGENNQVDELRQYF